MKDFVDTRPAALQENGDARCADPGSVERHYQRPLLRGVPPGRTFSGGSPLTQDGVHCAGGHAGRGDFHRRLALVKANEDTESERRHGRHSSMSILVSSAKNVFGLVNMTIWTFSTPIAVTEIERHNRPICREMVPCSARCFTVRRGPRCVCAQPRAKHRVRVINGHAAFFTRLVNRGVNPPVNLPVSRSRCFMMPQTS